jgi:hypothetical protein
MSDDEPTVSVKYSQYTKLREDQRAQQQRIYDLEKQLAEAQLGNDGSGAAKLLHEAFHEAIKVVQFAVGNLAPETVAGWPHEALVKIADAIEKIPGIDRHVGELPPELRYFAKLAAGYEEHRKQRAQRAAIAATAEDFGPKTAEATAVHATHKAAATPEPTVGVDAVATVQVPSPDVST